ALGINHIYRREELHVPFLKDAAASAVPPMDPWHRLFFEKLLDDVALIVAAEADQNERLAFELLDPLPFAGDHRFSRPGPSRPDIEHNDLALEIAELDLLAFEVGAFEIRSDFAYGEIANLEQGAFGFAQTLLGESLHVFRFFDRFGVERFNFGGLRGRRL